jgi:hypothetical protein
MLPELECKWQQCRTYIRDELHLVNTMAVQRTEKRKA